MFIMKNIALLLAFDLTVVSPAIALKLPFGNNTSRGSATYHQVKSRLQSDGDPLGELEPVRFGGNGFNPLITPNLSALVEQTIQEAQTPGLSLGVIHFDPSSKEISTEFGTWGVRNEDGDGMTQDTLFDIGSCSKAFLGAAMGILMDDFANGRNVTPLPSGLKSFGWKTKVRELFPGGDSGPLFADKWANEKANILDILSHVSGLPGHDLSYGPADSPSDLVKKLRYLKPRFELREQWLYNNLMYVLGADIISIYSGKPFTSFVEERIFTPLEMSSTTYSPEEAAQSGNFSQPFTLYEGNIRRIPFAFENDTVAELIAGAGGIISSTVDILKWLGMLLNEGVDPVSGKTIIPQSAFNVTTSAQSIVTRVSPGPGTSFTGYGVGWITASFYGHEVLQHDGSLQGFKSLITLLPSDGIGIVSFVNSVSDTPNLVATDWIVLDLLNMLPTSATSMDTELAAVKRSTRFSNANVALPNLKSMSGLPEMRVADSSYEVDFSEHTSLNTTAPELPLDAYAGTYSNPGYGSFTLCSSSSNSSAPDEYCTSTFSDFAKVFPNSPPSSEKGLYGTWARIWADHVRALPTTPSVNSSSVDGNNQTYVDQVNANTFTLSFTTLYPFGYGKNSTPFYDGVIPLVAAGIFDVVDGEVKGLGVFEDAPPPSHIKDGGLEEIAEVYFIKTG